jgi:hypothetical protein
VPNPIQIQIRDAIHTLLLNIDGTGTYYNDLSQYISLDREDGLQINDPWNINLRIIGDEKIGENNCNEQRKLSIRIEITMRASTPAKDDLINAAADIRASLKGNRQLNGICDDIGYTRWEKPQNELREIITGVLWIEFEVNYRTQSFED